MRLPDDDTPRRAPAGASQSRRLRWAPIDRPEMTPRARAFVGTMVALLFVTLIAANLPRALRELGGEPSDDIHGSAAGMVFAWLVMAAFVGGALALGVRAHREANAPPSGYALVRRVDVMARGRELTVALVAASAGLAMGIGYVFAGQIVGFYLTIVFGVATLAVGIARWRYAALAPLMVFEVSLEVRRQGAALHFDGDCRLVASAPLRLVGVALVVRGIGSRTVFREWTHEGELADRPAARPRFSITTPSDLPPVSQGGVDAAMWWLALRFAEVPAAPPDEALCHELPIAMRLVDDE